MLAVIAHAQAPSGNVITIAGDGQAVFAGDGGQALAASFAGPRGTAIGPDGSIYVADEANARVRRIAPNGIVSTVAGNGGSDDTGDGGLATDASIGFVVSVAVDPVRNILYLATNDIFINRVRQVNLTTGIITNFAGSSAFVGGYGFSGDGGQATAAKFRAPEAVAVDRDGNVYIADVANNRIRKVVIATGIVTTIAGSGNPQFALPPRGDGGPATSAGVKAPYHVAVDRFGNVFLVHTNEPNGYSVRRVDAGTQIITTVAGNGTNAPGSGPATSMNLGGIDGIAVNAAGTVLFIVGDINTNQIFRVNLLTGQLAVVAGTGTAGFSGDGGPALAAEFNGPGGITLTPAGEILVSDSDNNRLRYIVPDSIALQCDPALAALRLPFVTGISGDLIVEHNDAVSTVNAGGVTSAGGNVVVTSNGSATTVDLGSLTTGGNIEVTSNGSATTIDLGSLVTAGNVDVTSNGSATTVDLGSLTGGGNIDVSSNGSATTIDLGSLVTAGNVDVTSNGSATTVDLGSLTGGGNIDVSSNGSATTIDLGSLTSSDGITISGNPSLTGVTMPLLTTVGSSKATLTLSSQVLAASPAANDHLGAAVAVSGNTLVVTAPEADPAGGTDAGAAFLLTKNGSGQWVSPTEITAGGFAGAGFGFGQCAALDGDTLMIGTADRPGAPGEVYVFTRSAGTWPTVPTQRLLSPQAAAPVNDAFGNAVSVAGDWAAISEVLDSDALDDTHAVGAVHLFQKTAGTWSAVQTLTPPRPKHLGRFGASVALSGTRLLVGAPGTDATPCEPDSGAAYVYELDAGTWVFQAALTPLDGEASDSFGTVALDGDTAIISAPTANVGGVTGAGAAYVFQRIGGVWREQAKLAAAAPVAGGHFGASVALSGAMALIGEPQAAPNAGRIHTFARNGGGAWLASGSAAAPQGASGDEFGSAVAYDGTSAAIGVPRDDLPTVDAGSLFIGAGVSVMSGSVTVVGNTNATAIDFGAMTSAGGDVTTTGNTNATAIDFGAMTSAGGDVTTTGNTNATAIDFGAMTSAGGDVTTTGNTNATAIDFGAMTSAGGGVTTTGNTNATAIDFGAMTSAGGGVTTTGNTNATAIDFGSMTSAGGDVTTTGNTNATAIDFGALVSATGDITIANNAPLVIINLSSLTTVGGGVAPATMYFNGGTVLFSNGFTIPGNVTLSGATTLAGNITNQGTIEPGNSPGRLDITGSLGLGATSALALEIAGAATGQFDVIAATGAVALGGTLSVSLTGNFPELMTSGASFTVLSAGAPVSGAFTNVASGGTLTSTDGYARFTVLYAGASAVQFTSLEIVDTDNDTLPDWWEDAHGLNKNGAADAPLDSDGDGTSNQNEFLARTDPQDRASAFRILSIQREGGDVRLTWSIVGGRSYRLQAAATLDENAFTDVGSPFNAPGTGESTTDRVDPNAIANGQTRFYRVRVE